MNKEEDKLSKELLVLSIFGILISFGYSIATQWKDFLPWTLLVFFTLMLILLVTIRKLSSTGSK